MCIRYWEVFIVLSLIAIYSLWHPLHHEQVIPYLYTYSYVLYVVLLDPYVATRNFLSWEFYRGTDVLN